ncbi:hypothetical protein, variant [Aphanomyces astaci]|nr:hypothetical protein, variant [Aphanomyces astaci]ETV82973.1 hypothetical protein, variant [Aphanomyces astaci]|eukprot:XP_009827644.1 hypothetical protein, variant [Aphanomyces astaci]
MEGSLAASQVSRWIHTNVVNDERTRAMWSEQMANGKAMVSSAIHGVEGSYNRTLWFGPFKAMLVSYYDTPANTTIVHGGASGSSSLFPNLTWVQACSLAYAQFSDFNLTSVEVTDMTSKGLEYSGMAVGSVVQLLFVLVTIVVAFVSIGLKSFFFVTSLFYLLSAKWDPIERIVHDLIPIAPEKRPAMVASLRRAIEGVFFLPMKISSLHAIVSLVSFSIVGTDFVFLGTLLSFFISIVPIIPPYLICLPYVCLRLSTSFVPAVALLVVHYLAFTWIDQVLYERSLTSINAYISALSVAFGVYVFGLEGVVFGPLLVCGVNWAYEISNHGVQAATSDDAVMTSPSSSPVHDEHGSIFSSAYRALSGGLLRSNLSRGFSFDSARDQAVVVVDVQVHYGKEAATPWVVRYVARKEWSYEDLVKNLCRTLHVSHVRGLYAKANHAQILGVEHMIPGELITVDVQDDPLQDDVLSASSARPPMHFQQHDKHGGRFAKAGKTTAAVARASSPSTTPTTTPVLVRRRSHASTTPRGRSKQSSLGSRRSIRSSDSGSSSAFGGDSDGDTAAIAADSPCPVTVDSQSESFDSAANTSFRSALNGLRIQTDFTRANDDAHGAATAENTVGHEDEPMPPPDKPIQPITQDQPNKQQPTLQPPTSPLYITEKVTTLRQRRGSMASPADEATKPGLWKSLFKPN